MRSVQSIIFLFVSAIGLIPLSITASPTLPGPIRFYSTIKSIGVEWDLTGDTNHSATCAVYFRKQNTANWLEFTPFFRVDFRGWDGTDSADRAYNMLAGSVMFLDPATTYEVKLELRDPDGGNRDTTLTIATRPVPALPKTGKTIHVAAGTGAGDGSLANPYKGLAAAQTAAQPGDIIAVHAGRYGNFIFSKSGSATAFLVWKAAGDGDAVLDYGRIAGHHVWLYGLKFVNSTAQTYALVGQSGSPSNVVSRCNFNGFNYNITMQSGSDDWYIADNVIVGDKTNPRVTGDFSGEGVELEHTSGHTVCYNSISRVADGVSYAQRNCDIYGNDIFDVVDDGVEPDYGYANIRVWGNRITNPRNHGFSFQPMNCGPWYFVRNQVVGVGCYMLKYRDVDRFLLAHNTFVGWNTLDMYDQNVLSAFSRNNLWIQAGGSGYIWEAMPCTEPGACTYPERWTPDWRTSVDYDGFDWGSSSPCFKWGNPVQRFSSVATFATFSGIEQHAVQVNKVNLFDSLGSPSTDSLYTRHYLTLKQGCAAIDTGVVIPGINLDYTGRAPDLGAYEIGKPLPQYGPRPEGSEPIIVSPSPTILDQPSLRIIPKKRGFSLLVNFAPGTKLDIALFSLSGKLAAQLFKGELPAGSLSLSFTPKISGIYSLWVKTPSSIITRQLYLQP
jgi:hypothetical protein